MKILVLGGGPAAEAIAHLLTTLGHAPERADAEGDVDGSRRDLIVVAGPSAGQVEACRRVRARVEPAVLLGVVEEDDPLADAVLEAGCTDLLRWPEAPTFLRARLRAALQRAEAAEVERDRAERFRLLFSNELDAISICDLGTGRFLDVNEAWIALYGYSREEAVGRMGPPDVSADPGDTRTAIHRLVSDGENCKLVRWHRDCDGNVFPVEIYAGSYAFANRRVMVAMIRDITDRVRLESQLRQADRLASVGTLAAGVAHEINNPLSFVVGNLEYLSSALNRSFSGAPLDPMALREAVEEARDGARRVREVVKDLKTFSRADDSQAEPVDVAAALDVAIRMLGNELRHRATLERDYVDVPRAQVNESRLGQVFVNLIANAVQSLPERPREQNRIRVRVRRGARGEVVAEVIDNGAGIPPDIHHRIFDPFFSTKQIGEGTGLGLAICQGIVTGFGGRLEVDSELGHGSIFRVVLPAAAQPVQLRGVSAPQNARSAAKALKLLLIDDERNLGLVLARALQPAIELHFVTDAREGLRRIEAGEHFEAIVCDLMMPSMSGMEFYAELERVKPELAARTGFITGGTFTPPARAFASRVAGRIIEKPFLAEDLQRFVQLLGSLPPTAGSKG